MKKVLITGGLGFLGSHLIDELAVPDTQIHVVDNLTSNVIEADERINTSYMDLQAYLNTTGVAFDEIYHLASIVGPAGVLPYAGRIALNAINDAFAIAAKSVSDGAKLVFVSTSEVYGGGDKGLCAEDMACLVGETSARQEYAVGKLAAESCLINLSRTRGLKVVIARPFNIAGPRQQAKGGFVLPRFIDSAKAGQPLTVFGDGSQIRAFTHARDVATGLKLLMAEGVDGEVYNVGTAGNKTTIKELAEKVILFTNSTSVIDCVDPKAIFGSAYVEASDKFPDSTKLEALGWQPTRDLETIIKETIDAATVDR